MRRLCLAVAVALAASGLLAACSVGQPGGPVTLTRSAVRDGQTVSAWQYSAARGPVLLEVWGSPTGQPPAAFARTLADVMPSPPFHQRARWTLDPAQAGDPDNRIVLMFGSPVAARGAVPCDDPRAVPVAQGMPGGTAIQMTFCSGDSAMGETRITGPAVDGPGDPLLHEMLRRGLGKVVPPRATEFDDGKRLMDRRCLFPLC